MGIILQLASEDPRLLTPNDWMTTSRILHFLWFNLATVIIFASLLLLAHALIPSMLASGHIPPGVRNFARKQRIPMYVVAFLLVGVVAFWLSQATHFGYDVRDFYNRFWI